MLCSQNLNIIKNFMNKSYIVSLLKQGRSINALAAFHVAFRSCDRLSARDLLLRARILANLENYVHATHDIDKALAFDEADPDILLFAAYLKQKIDPYISHNLALKVLASVGASSRHRKAALRFVRPQKVPLFVKSQLEINDRITTIQWADQSASLKQLASGDFEETLGFVKVGEQILLAKDYYIEKPKEGNRAVSLEISEINFEIDIESKKYSDNARIATGTHLRSNPWIIIPVHDGGKILARCINSVLKELSRTPRSRLIIVNDASKERSTSRVLSAALKHERVRVITTRENKGFVGAVNLGLRSIGPGPVLLLNSDTYLPKGLLRRLVYHLKEEDIGTVTPFSNNGGSFSVPKARTSFFMPSEPQIEQLSALAFERNAHTAVEVMNGNGYAMLISEKCIKETGFLSDAFQSGYYEEVDFCIRASMKGFRHLAAVDCFVGHVGGSSFGDAKRKLISENYRTLIRKYPFYEQAYERYAQINPLKEYSSALVENAEWEPKKKPDLLNEARTESRWIEATSLPIFIVKGDPDVPLERLQLSSIALLPQDAVECCGQRIQVTSSLYMMYDLNNGLQVINNSGEVIDRLSLHAVTLKNIQSFEDRVLKIFVESRKCRLNHQ